MNGIPIHQVAQAPNLRTMWNLSPLTSYNKRLLCIYERPDTSALKWSKALDGQGAHGGPG